MLLLDAVPGYAVHMPGRIQTPALSLSGDKAADYFQDVLAGSFSSRPRAWRSICLTYPSFADLQLKQAMIKAASHVYLVADSTKINRSSFTRLGTLDVINSFVTDDGIRDEDVRAFESRGIKVIIAEYTADGYAERDQSRAAWRSRSGMATPRGPLAEQFRANCRRVGSRSRSRAKRNNFG